MTIGTPHPPVTERRPRDEIATRQAELLTRLLRAIDGRNLFYSGKLAAAGLNAADLEFPRDLNRLPLTTKAELVADQDAAPPWGTVLTEPLDRYTRYNQTSSTTGRPLRWLDTAESWQWMLECWKAVYRGARVGSADRILFPFSFGPFLGFWTAYDAGAQIGAHCIPAGGMTSHTRLGLIHIVEPTVICCTPTYALRLIEVARETHGPDSKLSESSVRVLIVAGEPGGSIPATRARIEQGWGARVIDHHGLTEVGPVSFECWESPGFVHLNECEFICEVLDAEAGTPVPDGDAGELIITTLGRTASPVVRYRTGDIVVRTTERCACGRTLARLEGGIKSRADDMVNVCGVNVYPTAIEAVLRAMDEIVEYRATVESGGALRALSIEIELAPSTPEPDAIASRAARRLREALGLNAPVVVVGQGTLPRFEMKAKRFLVRP